MTTTEAGDDVLAPFLIDANAIRGRLVRLGPSLDRILTGHDYPPVVSLLLAEALTLAAVLAGALKFDGVFTLQIQGDGAVPLLIADVTSAGDLRGYARFDADKLALAQHSDQPHGPVPRYLGRGLIAFTVDPGGDSERYQGIVELQGDSLEDCAQLYFRQSEQLETGFKLAARGPTQLQGWRAGALMIQRMPLGPTSPILTAPEADETWNRACILMASTTPQELLDRRLPPSKLLYRLYHSEQLRLYPARPLRAHCRCSSDRVEATLRAFPRAEIEDLKDEQNRVSVTCEYCKSSYFFAQDDLDRLYGS